MRKIIQLFLEGNKNPEVNWVFEGHGEAYIAFDGIEVLIKNRIMHISVLPDFWVPADVNRYISDKRNIPITDGIYILVGPKINNNSYNLDHYEFVKENSILIEDCPRDFISIKNLLLDNEYIDGVLFIHEDGKKLAKTMKGDLNG